MCQTGYMRSGAQGGDQSSGINGYLHEHGRGNLGAFGQGANLPDVELALAMNDL